MANWLEISIPAHGELEAVCARLAELGLTEFQVEDEADFQSFLANNTQYWDFVDAGLAASMAGKSRVKLWLVDDEEGCAMAAKLQEEGFAPHVRKVSDADWENNWRDYYQPLEIGDRLVVVPAWQTYNGEGRVPVRLDPGLLFGTGEHPTTRMCLQAVERWTRAGDSVLDLGCGCGILGIAAAVLGAGSVTAVDVDEKAPEIVLANASLNGVDGVFHVCVGDVVANEHLRARLGGGYSLVLANIVADVIISLAARVSAFMAPDGTFVCSGIIDGKEDDTAAALQQGGLTVQEHRREEEWHCFVCRRGNA